MDPRPFIRGVVFEGTDVVPYPRANPKDMMRMPIDTWECAQIPAGVRLELDGDAEAIEITYAALTDRLGVRGAGAGTTFQVWRGNALVSEEPASLGEGTVKLALGAESLGSAIVYLPAGMRPVVSNVEAVGGDIEPASAQPTWIAYGDSVAEGWMASVPALAWPAIAGREHGLDVANLGYAGAARGEIVSAEQIASVGADVISITHGTNCWTLVPHTVAQMRANTAAFLDVVRQGHPDTPVVVSSPVLRPDAESTPNRLGATLADLRKAMEDAVSERDDPGLRLVPGSPLLDASLLADGIHPNDEGHRALADALGSFVAELVR